MTDSDDILTGSHAGDVADCEAQRAANAAEPSLR